MQFLYCWCSKCPDMPLYLPISLVERGSGPREVSRCLWQDFQKSTLKGLNQLGYVTFGLCPFILSDIWIMDLVVGTAVIILQLWGNFEDKSYHLKMEQRKDRRSLIPDDHGAIIPALNCVPLGFFFSWERNRPLSYLSQGYFRCFTSSRMYF